MKTLTKDELTEAIRLHDLWLNNAPKGKRFVAVTYDLRSSNPRSPSQDGTI